LFYPFGLVVGIDLGLTNAQPSGTRDFARRRRELAHLGIQNLLDLDCTIVHFAIIERLLNA
jgi:hypothetical protein